LRLLLDTHVWLWWLTGAEDLPAAQRVALDRLARRGRPALSVISLWEAQLLVSKGRLDPAQPFSTWIRRMAAPDVVELIPMDVDVILALHSLPLSFHGDPADRLIVATALAHGLTLATHDRAIRRARLTKLWKR
jgi:PIN domain nuclease of toxin-antitoxin system